MLLTSITVDERKITLADRSSSEETNVVSVMIGSNGCGKSRLFQAVCSSFIKSSHTPQGIRHHELHDVENLLDDFDDVSYVIDGNMHLIRKEKSVLFGNYNFQGEQYIRLTSYPPYDPSKTIVETNCTDEGIIKSFTNDFHRLVRERIERVYITENGSSVDNITTPDNILAVTGSPYDKFPFTKSYSRREIIAPYVYLGAREKRHAGARSERGYLSSKFDQLGASFIKLLLKPKQSHIDFTAVFDALDLYYSFELTLTLDERVRHEEVTEESILKMVDSVRFLKERGHTTDFTEEEKEILPRKLIEAINNVFGEKFAKERRHFEPVEVTCKVDFDGEDRDVNYLNYLALLSEFDLVELRDVLFRKRGTDKKFYLSQASSGELSLLFTMSSIAGNIKDNSLVLLDEPEISLNPEWQLKFIPLLLNVFSKYKSCHFIIATHSPNIISSMPDSNAFVVDLSGGNSVIQPSFNYHNRSADYQLAMLFKSPGFKNEFLISEAIDILSKLSQQSSSSPDELSKLKQRALFMFELRERLLDDDPVLKLINTIERAIEVIQCD
ncbi:TPA: AAA family ATPase [Vibrio parahaemolyticus]